jgi:geranylgeranyl pyrophosphate synthase
MGVERAIERVDRNVARCARIIDDILDFTSREKILGKPVDAIKL